MLCHAKFELLIILFYVIKNQDTQCKLLTKKFIQKLHNNLENARAYSVGRGLKRANRLISNEIVYLIT